MSADHNRQNELERQLTRTLRDQPLRRAPSTLERRVLAQIEAGAVASSWRRGFAHWPMAGGFRYDALTTVGNWRGYGSIEHSGEFYGQKAHSLREMVQMLDQDPAPGTVTDLYGTWAAAHADAFA